MAKFRRVVRKVGRQQGDVFDEQLWPTYIALVVLGSFSMGVSAAYLKFTDTPWYANALIWLTLIPLSVVGVMLCFRYVDNRAFRRSMQFSIVVCATLHLAIIVQMIETTLFAPREKPPVTAQVVEARPPKILNEYHPSQLLPDEDRPRNDFERPVETETPQPVPKPEEVDRQQAEHETTPPPQPVPVPESVPTTEPNVIRRQEVNQAAPRQAATASKLSRQSKPSELKISQQLIEATPAPTEQARGAPTQAAASPIKKQESSDAVARQAPAEPTTTQDRPTPEVSRRSPTDSPQPEATSTPTLKRQIAQPAATPRSQIAAAENPSQAERTQPDEVRPANTTSQKRSTASPETARTAAEPVPDVSREPTAQPQRRQAASDIQPTVAQAPAPVPNRTPRATSRPDVATQAATEAPSTTSGQTAATPTEIAPTTTSVQRTVAAVTAPMPTAIPSAEPNTAQVAQPAARVTRSQAQPNPAAQASPTTPTLTRRSAAPSIPQAASVAQTAPAASATAPSAGELSPTSTATRRQSEAATQAATATGQPSPSQIASSIASPSTSSSPARRATATNSATDSPVVGESPNSATSTTRSTAAAVANIVTTVSDVAANTGPATSSEVSPGPSATSVSRQASTTTATASRNQPALTTPASSPSTQVARGGATRAETALVPSINSSNATAGPPARAVASAPTATSPTSVESPTANVASQGAGDVAVQPARMALSKSIAGTAGAGRSENVDRGLPGGESPAMVASSAARRSEATQEAPPGAALSPSATATVARSMAGAQVPTASFEAQDVEVATTGGATDVGPQAASASAALTRADAAAKQGEVTGAKGTADVDLGPTQIVSEAGSGKASGGGQPELNLAPQSAQLARRADSGGGPAMSLVAQAAETVAAPDGTSGGSPAAMEANPAAVAATRTNAGGQSANSGGPSTADERGPQSEPSSATLLADASLSRADAADGGAGAPAAAGEPGVEDEEEKARRLARAALGGAPQLAIAGPVVAEVSVSPTGDGGDGGAPQVNPQAAATAVSTGRQNVDGGAPSGGAPLAVGDPQSGAGSSGAETIGSVTVARAEASDAAAGPTITGGGSATPSRAAAGPTLAAATSAEFVEVAGAPASGGVDNGAPLEAQGVEATRLAGGPAGEMVEGPTGAIAGAEIVDASAPGLPGNGIGRRQASSGDDGPAIGDVATTGAPGRRGPSTNMSAGALQVEAVPETGPTSAVAQAELDHTMGNMGTAPMSRPSEGEALAVNIEAPEGPGGIGADYSPEVGLNTRQARSDSVEVHVRTARFVRQVAGGLPAVSTAAIVSTESFSKRADRTPGSGGQAGRGSPPPQTEEAVEMGLKFLARYQGDNGSWSLQALPEETVLVSDTGATALCLISFQGAGYHHREHGYKDVVRNGLNYLVQNQKENGDLFVPLDDNSNRSVWLYSHSLATIALCEAYGMTQDPELREPAQKAVDFIIAAQHDERGGWRYSPGIGADTSVTGWMMMALKSAELAELKVPKDTYEKIGKWLTLAQQSPTQPHLYRYNPYAPDTKEQRHGKTASKTMTSVGLLMRLYSGWKRDNPNFVRGADYLRENLPELGTAREPQRDTYYWYYATQVMFHMGGDYWKEWNGKLHPLLVNSQVKQGPLAGSWDPRGPVPDRWGVQAGRLYVTTMNLLSLEVYYRHLPLYEDTAK
jgi:hypothetical protein